jgi:hypothetical protein
MNHTIENSLIVGVLKGVLEPPFLLKGRAAPLSLNFWFTRDVRKYLLGFCQNKSGYRRNKLDQQIIYHSHTCKLNNETVFFEKTLEYAAEQGYLKLLDWSRSMGWRWTTGLCESAAEVGRLDILKWLRSHPLGPAPWSESICEAAAQYGHLNVLQWAIENGALCDAYVAYIAVKDDQKDIFYWLMSTSKPIYVNTLDRAQKKWPNLFDEKGGL